jgi:hypothetical protein
VRVPDTVFIETIESSVAHSLFGVGSNIDGVISFEQACTYTQIRNTSS